jgi:hypothetical protein
MRVRTVSHCIHSVIRWFLPESSGLSSSWCLCLSGLNHEGGVGG